MSCTQGRVWPRPYGSCTADVLDLSTTANSRVNTGKWYTLFSRSANDSDICFLFGGDRAAPDPAIAILRKFPRRCHGVLRADRRGIYFRSETVNVNPHGFQREHANERREPTMHRLPERSGRCP